MTLTAVISYPLKSAGACLHQEAQLTPRGLDWDRRWMVVDADGHFLSARKHSRMLLLKPRINEQGTLSLMDPSGGVLHPIVPMAERKRTVQVWSDRCEAHGVSQDVDDWISAFIGQKTHLVFMPGSSHRAVRGGYAVPNDLVGFADGFPLLLTQSSSLDDLNGRMVRPLPMNRFRPNLVVHGGPAFDELTWRRIRIGESEFVTGGPCVRCSMTTVDAHTGRPGSDGEPLKTLATYQRSEKGVVFGINLIPRRLGILRIGDSVNVLERLENDPHDTEQP